MHVTHRLTLRALLAAVLAIGTASASLFARAASDDAMAPTDKQLNQLYWQGHEALHKGDWAAALKRFSDLEQQMRAKEPQNADAAVYWQAYTLFQAKRTTEGKAAVERLHRDFPKSRWGKDADTLLRQGQAPATAIGNAGTVGDDEELAEVAVEGLMSAPPERAIPLLKKVLQSQHSDKVKKRALFVLSQLDNPAALDAVVDVARTSNDPELREEAVRMLGVSGEERAIERLRELYASSKDPREKRAIIQAWLVADRKDLILASARDESDESVRKQAIEALGALDASTELKQLFDTTHDAANQRAIIQALGVAGNVKALGEIAESQQPEPIRIEAIHALGVAGDEGGNSALVKLYPKAATPALRDAVIQGLMVAGDNDAMMQLYRQAKTTEEKQALLRVITTMGGDAALDLIESELNKPEPKK
ncbi:MAG TPA: HEAT repeat domain-containing protein [Rudaea sp.]|nr:HEAT repeat domain-containing protein [Rudaea sp.]